MLLNIQSFVIKVSMVFQELAPIAVFAYNRPNHLERTLHSLRENLLADQSEVFIFCDGPKGESDRAAVLATREVAKSTKGFKRVIIHESGSNKGLAQSIIEGVTQICTHYGEVIVLEDDMLSSTQFLTFMNQGLRTYREDQRVVSIHGYTYPLKKHLTNSFFLRGADCWGWATWKRGWDIFESDSAKLAKELSSQNLINDFNYNGGHDYYKMLLDNIAGKNNSWAIRWYASAFLANKLTLYPPKSLILNFGLDSSGTHCSVDQGYEVKLSNERIKVNGIEVKENQEARRAFEQFFRNQRTYSYRLKTKLKKIFG